MNRNEEGKEKGREEGEEIMEDVESCIQKMNYGQTESPLTQKNKQKNLMKA